MKAFCTVVAAETKTTLTLFKSVFNVVVVPQVVVVGSSGGGEHIPNPLFFGVLSSFSL